MASTRKQRTTDSNVNVQLPIPTESENTTMTTDNTLTLKDNAIVTFAEQTPATEQTPVNETPAVEQTPTMDKSLAKVLVAEYDKIFASVLTAYNNIAAVIVTDDTMDADEVALTERMRTKALARLGYTGNMVADFEKLASAVTIQGYNVFTAHADAKLALLDKKALFEQRHDALNASEGFKNAAAAMLAQIALYKANCAEFGIDPSYVVLFEGENAPCILHKGTRHAKTVKADGTPKTVVRYDSLNAGLNIHGNYTDALKLHLTTDNASASVTVTDKNGKQVAHLDTFRSKEACKLRNLPTIMGFLRATCPAILGSKTELNMAQMFPGVTNLYDLSTAKQIEQTA